MGWRSYGAVEIRFKARRRTVVEARKWLSDVVGDILEVRKRMLVLLSSVVLVGSCCMFTR